MENRDKKGCTPVHVINIDVEDNHEEATIGAILISDLVNLVRATFGGMNKSLIQHFATPLHISCQGKPTVLGANTHCELTELLSSRCCRCSSEH
jgi:hypothetical protein